LRGAVVAPSHAADVVTPAYDALTPADRRRITADHPDSFLAALPADTTDIDAADFAACRDAVDRLLASGRFHHRGAPFVVLYRLRSGTHDQTALLCDLDTSAVDDGLIVGHEHTRTAREDHLVTYLREVRITSSPVCVMHTADRQLATLVARASARPADITIEDPDLTQEVWVVDDEATVAQILDVAGRVGRLVITDGHHRTAAARRFADEATHPAGGRVLVAMFPAEGVQIREFNRVVTPVGVTAADLIAGMTARGLDVTPLPEAEHPQGPARFTMVAEGRWWHVSVPAPLIPDDLVGRLDVSLLHDHVLAPLLDVTSPRTDPRLRFVPGVLGLEALADEAAGGIGFALHPVDTDDVAHIALAGRTLPPKSTYLHPKARSGLLLLPRR
jgi:uncharacterized protein (DUF1015 family)